MAAINKIRQHSGLLLIVIGMGMAAFIFGGLFKSGGQSKTQYIGEVNGKKIDRLVYEREVEDQLQGLRSTNQNPDGATTDRVRGGVWNDILLENTVIEQLKDAGFMVTQDEYDDIRWGDNVNPSFRNDPNFSTDGIFDPNKAKQYFNFINTRYPIYAQLQQKQLIQSTEINKYYNAIKAGLKANNLESVQLAANNDSKISFNFVYKQYSTVPDSTVQINEEEVKKYYHEHKGEKKYKQVESRDAEYVEFDVIPTANDIKFIKLDIEELIPSFKNATSDSVFIAANSESKNEYRVVYNDGMVPDSIVNEQLLTAQIGDVIGPYEVKVGADSFFKIAKVIDEYFENQARVRHILLKTNGVNDDELKLRADSIKNVIRRNKNFSEMVTVFSEDVASIKDGGVYEWFPEGRMVAEFNDAAFSERIGNIVVVKTTYGYHIMEVLGRRNSRQPVLAIVDQKIVPSPGTFNDVYSIATDFSIDNSNLESFNSAATELNMEVKKAIKIKKGSKRINDLNNTSEITRWLYKSEVGDISTPFEIENKFIVAIVTKKTAEGEPEFDDVKEQFKTLAIFEKKKDLIYAEMEGITDVQELANSLSLRVQTASNIPFSSNTIPGAGNADDEVLGSIFTLEVGDVSIPLKGKAGVYVVEITDKSIPNFDDLDPELFADDINRKYESSVNTGVFNALREDADVKDNRADFY